MELIQYYTMNSWNRSTSPAYNMKIHNVISPKYRDKVYEMMECDGFYDGINEMIDDFGFEHNFEYQAGFNGHSGWYLVLYVGGKGEDGRVFSFPGKGIDKKDVPKKVLKRFEKLAEDIVKSVENMAENAIVEDIEEIVMVNKKIINFIK